MRKGYQNNLFSNHFLEERIQDLDEWQETDFEEKFDELKEIYDEKQSFLSEKLNEDQTQNKFIDPVLKLLGHEWVPEARTRVGSKKKGTMLNPDYTFMDLETQMDVHEDDEKSHFDVNYAVGDAKAWNRTLDKSTQDHTNPAFQIYNYVDRLRADWGILTNGKKWRLYSYEKCAADIYFEIDLEELLSGEKTDEKLEQFKYFYLFFRAESFEEGFLEKVYQQSVEYNESLEDDLEDKVYNALEVAVEGFFKTNDIEKTEENIDLVHHSSLIFLYRILFILNAESRDLLPTDDEAYRQAFGLTELKRMIIDEEEEDPLFQDTTVAWDNRLSRLFEGIDDGYDLHETEIPAYNGGLFDEENGEENQFLAENKLYGSYIKEILELLATNYDEEKEQRVILDYKDLNIRHLGSVYEGLLEHQFKAADERKILKNEEWQNFSETSKDWESFDEEKRVEENELYLTNESGERKATGSYYTPEYIVEYIVENTVGPKVEEKIEQAEENNENVLPKVLELNVCDPAMGSGHFLTEATEFIAENIVEHADLEEQEIDENEDELNWAKRQVVQNCIYGVDINELAVELGKLSLWIETMAEGKPLNFLDHHLKHGNSLIGSDFDEIFSHPTEDQTRLDSERYQFGDPQEIKENFQEQYLEIEQMPENTVQQIHKKEQAYKQFISQNTLYQQFQQLANIHTRQHFQKEANSSDYESFLINIGNPSNPFENNEWYKNAQQDAKNRNYFHWQLEFPKVFFGEQEGFDAVVGNPPYIPSQQLPEFAQDYFSERYTTSFRNYDAYVLFVEQALNLMTEDAEFGYIIPNKFLKSQYGEKMKNLLTNKSNVQQLIDFDDNQVFGDATNYVCILIFEKSSDQGSAKYYKGDIEPEEVLDDSESFTEEIPEEAIQDWQLIDRPSYQIVSKIDGEPKLGEISETIYEGARPGGEEYYILTDEELKESEIEQKMARKFIKADDIDDYEIKDSKKYVIFPYHHGESGYSLVNLNEYPNTLKYLKKHSDDIYGASGEEFGIDFEYGYYHVPPELDSEDLIICPDIAKENEFALMRDSYLFPNTVYATVVSELSEKEQKNLLGLMNSSLLEFRLKLMSPNVRGGYYRYKTEYLEKLPIKSDFEEIDLSLKTKRIENKKRELQGINLNILDYLGNSVEDSDGQTLGELYMPVEGLSDKVVSDTSADRDSLKIGSVEFEESNDELILKVSARYKPDGSEGIDESELDQWGYHETGKVPAMKFTGLSKEMKSLVQEFTKLAVDEAGGFADFRESATKTNSIIDRLEKLTLPKLDDVEQGLEKFIENREEAEELEEEIQETDELIDAIVFDLYDLTEEEVETVLDSLDTSEGEKSRILEKFSEVSK